MRLLPDVRKDRRRHKRVDLELHGRFLDDESEDHSLKTVNISCSGALLATSSRPAINASIVCYFDDLGRVAATVVRHTDDGFAVKFKAVEHKKDKLADRLTWLLNKNVLGLPEERLSQRYPASGSAIVTRKDGRQMQCRVLDISLTGASFETDGPVPLVGEMVTAGNLKGEIVRSQRGSFAIRYIHKGG